MLRRRGLAGLRCLDEARTMPRMACTPRLVLLLPAALALLSACVTQPSLLSGKRIPPVYTHETFAADDKHSRLLDAPVAEACEAARRALLSQGYVVTRAETRLVQGAKRFQPEGEVHVEISFHIVCAAEAEQLATVFVSAQQDKYVLKKNPNSASVGVSAIGSISVPVGSTEDSLVKVASETIPAGVFYDRFFALVQRQLRAAAAD
jgi:Uncharacterized protein conserved in bacteria (DUF2242)